MLLFFLLSFHGTHRNARAASVELEDILNDLNDESPIRRFKAIEDLGKLETPESIKTLINLTTDENNCWLAVRQLVVLRDKAVPYLMEALNDTNSIIVKYAVYALGELKCQEAVEPILGYLSNSDPEIRRNSVFALGYIKDPRAIEPLLGALKDPDGVVREYAAAALEYLGDKRAVPFLEEALRVEQGSVFNMATALYNLGSDEVISLLIEKLKNPYSSNRLYAVYALGKIRDVREVQPLIESLTDENVQWLSAKALINLSDLAVPSLVKALKRNEMDIRLYSTYVLGELGDSQASQALLDNLINPNSLLRDYTAEALIKIKDRGIIPRLYYLLEKGDSSIQSHAIKILGSLGDVSTSSYIYPLLSSDSSLVRMHAASALGELRDTKSVGKLIDLLGDENSSVSLSAARALINIGPDSIPVLIDLLPRKGGRAETGTIYILGKLKATMAVDILTRKLTSPDAIVRRYATAALTEIGDQRSEEHLVMMLSDPDPAVRIYASVGLMEFGGRISVKLLLNSLRSEETRWLAVRILDKIGPRGIDEMIAALKDESIQWYATQTLIKLDGAILTQLEEGLRSDEEVIRNNIAFILGEVKDKRSVNALLDAMKDESRVVSLAASSLVSIADPASVEPLIQCLSHQNSQVRLYAAYALGHFRDERALFPLIRCLKDDDSSVRGIAAYSLGLLGSSRATIPLIEMIDDIDENVRLSVVYGLRKIGDPQATPFINELFQKDKSFKVRRAAHETLQEMPFSSRR